MLSAQTQKQAELRDLMRKHSLTYAALAALAGVKQKTVEGWLASPDAKSHRAIHRSHMELIKLRLGGR